METAMKRKLAVLGLLAMLLAAPGLQAQAAAAGTARPAANPVNPAAIQALKDMGAHLQTLKRFQVSTELTGEVVLASGQKLQHTAKADMKAVRPNKLRVAMESTSSSRELIYDGKTLTLWTPERKYFSTVEFEDTLGGLINLLEEKYGVQLPMEDFFRWGTPDAPFDKIESAMNAGQALVGGDLCDHYAFRQGSIDWQIWISAGSKPLPRKLVITNRADEARPQSIQLFDWNLKPGFKDAVFRFTPPRGATAIEMLPRKTR
jgi:hypothetical protein